MADRRPSMVGSGMVLADFTLCLLLVRAKIGKISADYNGTKDVTKTLSELTVIPNGFGMVRFFGHSIRASLPRHGRGARAQRKRT